MGLAAAITEHLGGGGTNRQKQTNTYLACSWVTIPAFEIEIVCCSMAWKTKIEKRNETNDKTTPHLVDGSPVGIVHLVELVNETDSLVCQDQSSGFQGPFLGLNGC